MYPIAQNSMTGNVHRFHTVATPAKFHAIIHVGIIFRSITANRKCFMTKQEFTTEPQKFPATKTSCYTV